MIRVEAQGGGKTFASRGTPGVPARNIVHSACRPRRIRREPAHVEDPVEDTPVNRAGRAAFGR